MIKAFLPVLPVLTFFNTETPVLRNGPGIGCTSWLSVEKIFIFIFIFADFHFFGLLKLFDAPYTQNFEIRNA
jgi:hypothetical protein